MSVELLDTPRFFGYRVRRQIQGKTYQEYFSLKEDGKRMRGERRNAVKAQAEARDEELSRQQDSLQQKRAKEIRVDDNGQVRGILCRLKAEKSGNKTPVFQIGVMSLLENRIVNTTVSINRFGIDEAWQRAVEFYARHKKINKRSSAYRALVAARPGPAQVERLLKSGNSRRRTSGRRTAPRKGGTRKARAGKVRAPGPGQAGKSLAQRSREVRGTSELRAGVPTITD